jgi:hypothetical protein
MTNSNNSTTITGTRNTTMFALSSIIKQWEMKLAKKMQMGALKTNPQFKKAVLGHMGNLFQMDDSFEKLNGRNLYNSVVNALTSTGVITEGFVKEIYTKKESEILVKRGQRIDDIHIV